MNNKVVRRIRVDKNILEAIKRLNIKSFNEFAVRAIAEKLERDYKIKEHTPF